MRYLDYKEQRQHGTYEFPLAYYHVCKNHPRYQMPYHWHPEYEIIRILEGELYLTLDRTSLTASKGDVLFIMDGVLHGGRPNQCVYECIVFDIKSLLKSTNICSKHMQSIINHEIKVNQHLTGNIPSLKYAIDNLFQAMAEQKKGYEFLIYGSLCQLLGIVISENLYDINKNSNSSATQHIHKFKNVFDFIENHYMETIRLSDLAEIAGMSSKYFCRAFREITGRTPIDYLNYYRVEYACEQLSAMDATITEVAFNCGFNDISYFIKTFKKHKGITPKKYQKAIKL